MLFFFPSLRKNTLNNFEKGFCPYSNFAIYCGTVRVTKMHPVLRFQKRKCYMRIRFKDKDYLLTCHLSFLSLKFCERSIF